MYLSWQFHPSTGITPPKQNPGYASYRSPYGPKYVFPGLRMEIGKRSDELGEEKGRGIGNGDGMGLRIDVWK